MRDVWLEKQKAPNEDKSHANSSDQDALPARQRNVWAACQAPSSKAILLAFGVVR